MQNTDYYNMLCQEKSSNFEAVLGSIIRIVVDQDQL